MKKICFFFSLSLSVFTVDQAAAQHTHLHVDPRWQECSFHLDSSLTQNQFQKFTQEAGLVAYFRPLTDARPMGAGTVELSLLQWQTWIDENSDAWNNTFVHPDSTHWLVDGPKLAFPGLMLRAGLTRKLDAGIYWTARPGANYGFFGAQLQYCFLENERGWAAAARTSFMSLYGPDDLGYQVYGLDVVGSKKIMLYKNWLSISPYSYASLYCTHGHEKSAIVSLGDENRFGVQACGGATLQVSILRLGAEYNFARVNSLSFKMGVAYNFCSGKNKTEKVPQ